MKQINAYLLCMLGSISLTTPVFAVPTDLNHQALMTARDVDTMGFSNISLINQNAEAITASGLFIASVDINDCSSCFGAVVSSNELSGVVLSPVTFHANQSLPIGQNYLYNMIYNEIYYIKNTDGATPCALPGCSWPGDDPNVKGWCVTINAIAPHSSYTYSSYINGANPPASAPPYSRVGNSSLLNYQYDLIDPNTFGIGNACLGPIICNDKTLTCQVSAPQNEVLQAYHS